MTQPPITALPAATTLATRQGLGQRDRGDWALEADQYLWTPTGQRYDRVSRVLSLWPSPELAEWREQVGKAVANRTAKQTSRLGNLFDQAVGRLLQYEPIGKVPVEVGMGLRGFKDWHELNPFKPLAIQQTVWDDTLGIAGTPDCLADDEFFDWKLTGRISMKHVLQLVFYWPMIEAVYGITLRQARVVRFDRTLGIFQEKTVTPAIQANLYPLCGHLVKVYQGWRTLTELQEVA